jgi:DNA-directed RNA polymerase subunit RPC12/RpoP
MSDNKWKLKGYDTFEEKYYNLPGEHNNKEEAEKAAQSYLQELESTQPSATSGGQSGIQDQVYIVSPEGEERRVRPRPETWKQDLKDKKDYPECPYCHSSRVLESAIGGGAKHGADEYYCYECGATFS